MTALLAVVLVLAAIGFLLGAFMLFGRLSVRRQREALATARTNGADAWRCAGQLGMWRASMRLLVVDDHAATQILTTGDGPRTEWTAPRGTIATPGRVRVNAGRTVDGIHLRAPDGVVHRTVIYPDPTLGVDHPLPAEALGPLVDTINRRLASMPPPPPPPHGP